MRRNFYKLCRCWITTTVVSLTAVTHSYAAKFDVKITSVADFMNDPSLQSREGRGIPLVRMMPKASKIQSPRFYLQAALHGNETLTAQFLFWLIRRVETGESPLAKINSGQVEFDIIPAANPDGIRLRTRTNAASVNLNRNFSIGFGTTREYPGKASFSEPETRAIKALFARENYSAAIDIHGFVNWLVIPSAPTAAATTEQIQNYKKWHDIVLNNRPLLQTVYQIKNPRVLGDGGAFEDWSFWEAHVPAICLEMASAFRFDVIYGRGSDEQRVDLFERYENFIAATFQNALTLRPNTLTN